MSKLADWSYGFHNSEYNFGIFIRKLKFCKIEVYKKEKQIAEKRCKYEFYHQSKIFSCVKEQCQKVKKKTTENI